MMIITTHQKQSEHLCGMPLKILFVHINDDNNEEYGYEHALCG